MKKKKKKKQRKLILIYYKNGRSKSMTDVNIKKILNLIYKINNLFKDYKYWSYNIF